MGKDKREKVKVTKRYRLSKKELKALRRELEASYPRLDMSSVGVVEYAKVGGLEFYVFDGTPAFVRVGGRLIPVLLYLIRGGSSWLPRVIVDRGATSALARGADLMVPGIRDLDDFEPGAIVAIVDEQTGVAVAVGEALMGSREIRERLEGERRGKAIRNIHRPGDRIWEAAKAI